MAFKFENLKVWQRSIDLSGEISQLIESFPQREVFILSSQLQRACDSIALNIAEGSTGQTTPEFKRFLAIAIRSGVEVVSCLYLARKRKLINDDQFRHFYDLLTDLIKGIQALKKSLK